MAGLQLRQTTLAICAELLRAFTPFSPISACGFGDRRLRVHGARGQGLVLEVAHTMFARRRRSAWHQWLLGFAIIALATVVAWQTSGTRSSDPAPASPQEQAMSEHCAEFIALAKTKFGENWKSRLPASGPCTKTIQQAWEREQAARAKAVAPQPVAPAPILPPTPTTPLELAPPIEAAAPPVERAAKVKTESRGNLDTYCLNVLWLARSKFGDDWKAHLTPRESAKCAAHGRHLR